MREIRPEIESALRRGYFVSESLTGREQAIQTEVCREREAEHIGKERRRCPGCDMKCELCRRHMRAELLRLDEIDDAREQAENERIAEACLPYGIRTMDDLRLAITGQWTPSPRSSVSRDKLVRYSW